MILGADEDRRLLGNTAGNAWYCDKYMKIRPNKLANTAATYRIAKGKGKEKEREREISDEKQGLKRLKYENKKDKRLKKVQI